MAQKCGVDLHQIAAGCDPSLRHRLKHPRIGPVRQEMHRKLLRDMAGGVGTRREVAQEGGNRRLSLAVIGFAQHGFRPRLGHAVIIGKAAPVVIGQAREQQRQLAHVGLIIGRAHPHRVQFQQFAREVFVQPPAAPRGPARVRPDRARLVKIAQHPGMAHHRHQHIGKAPRQMRAQCVLDKGIGRDRVLAPARPHREMIGPKGHQPFAQAIRCGDGAGKCGAHGREASRLHPLHHRVEPGLQHGVFARRLLVARHISDMAMHPVIARNGKAPHRIVRSGKRGQHRIGGNGSPLWQGQAIAETKGSKACTGGHAGLGLQKGFGKMRLKRYGQAFLFWKACPSRFARKSALILSERPAG